MKSNCRDYRDRLGDAAEGRADATLNAHLAECTMCTARVERMRAMIEASRFRLESAPSALIDSVKGLMTPKAHRVWATLVSTSRLAGARAEGDDFQAVYAHEGVTLRILATRTDDGWELMGRLPGDAWTVHANGEVEQEEGGFRVRTDNLETLELRVSHGESEIEIPNLLAEAPDDRS